MDAFHSDGLLRLPTSGAVFLVANPSLIWVREMGGSGGSETWIVCRRRLGSAWTGDVEAGDGVTEREREARVTERERERGFLLF